MALKRSALALAAAALVFAGCSSDPGSTSTASPQSAATGNSVPTTSAAPSGAPGPTGLTVQTNVGATDGTAASVSSAPVPSNTIEPITPSGQQEVNAGGLTNDEVTFVCGDPKMAFDEISRSLAAIDPANETVEEYQALSDSLGALKVSEVRSLGTLWNNLQGAIADNKAAVQTKMTGDKKAAIMTRIAAADAALVDYFALNCPNPR